MGLIHKLWIFETSNIKTNTNLIETHKDIMVFEQNTCLYGRNFNAIGYWNETCR